MQKKNDLTFTEKDIGILYLDNAICIIEKPAGLPSQPTLDPSRTNLYDLLKKKLKQENNISYVGLHHRLDRDTSGVMVFTVAEEANFSIGEQIKNHEPEKNYLAIVHGKIKNKSGKIESFLDEVKRIGKKAKYGSVKNGGKKAITHYEVLKEKDGLTLVKVKITTGRTHQIRVHFSEMGHPLFGDSLYGAPLWEYKKYDRFFLHSQSLRIKHPITQKEIFIETKTPEEFELFFKD